MRVLFYTKIADGYIVYVSVVDSVVSCHVKSLDAKEIYQTASQAYDEMEDMRMNVARVNQDLEKFPILKGVFYAGS